MVPPCSKSFPAVVVVSPREAPVVVVGSLVDLELVTQAVLGVASKLSLPKVLSSLSRDNCPTRSDVFVVTESVLTGVVDCAAAVAVGLTT